jgi:DNA polymerase
LSWSERQRQLLHGMGLRVWAPTVPASLPAAADAAVGAGPGASAGASVRAGEAAAAVAAPLAARPGAAGRAGPAAAPDPRADAVRAEPTFGSRPAATGLGWSELREAVAACRACALCDSRTQTVFGAGHPQAHWMVVGEAPGEQEDLRGEPFVGLSGELLDRMLAALRLTRSTDGPLPPEQRVYIANTLKCRPPRNRNPTAAELAQCEPFLVRQIELLQPRIILAMGRFAVQALLRSDEPIGKLRGRVHRYQGVPLVVTYHPAYLLRNLPDKAKAWEDLCLAAQVAEGPG